MCFDLSLFCRVCCFALFLFVICCLKSVCVCVGGVLTLCVLSVLMPVLCVCLCMCVCLFFGGLLCVFACVCLFLCVLFCCGL